MADISQDRQALDWLAKNPDAPQAVDVAAKLGVERQDVDAWNWARANGADMRAHKIKSVIYDKIAATLPTENIQGIGNVDRMVVKNLIDDNPKLQVEYLQKKGYRTRIKDGEIEVRRPEELSYKKVDPSSYDPFDFVETAKDVIADNLGTIVEGGAGMLATGEKLLGAIGSPVTGLTSAFAGAAMGGVTTGGAELAKQQLGKMVGARNEIDAGEVAKKTAIGASIPLLFSAGSAVLKGGSNLIGKASAKMSGGLKENADEIAAATESIGGKATPGQLIDQKGIQGLESTQVQSPYTIGGMGIRSQVKENVKAAKLVADDLVKEATEKTPYQVGGEIAEKISKAVSEKIKPAVDTYEKYEGMFGKIPLTKTDDISPLNLAFDKVKQEFEFNPAAVAKVSEFEGLLGKVDNLDKLKSLRTAVGRAATNPDPEVRAAVGSLRRVLTDARSQILEAHAEKLGGNTAEIAIAEIHAADKLYAATAREVENLIEKPAKGGMKEALSNYIEKHGKEGLPKDILDVNNYDRLIKIKDSFPEVYEAAREFKISEIAKKSMTGDNIDPRKLAKSIEALPKEAKQLIFGEDSAKKAKDLMTYFNSLPKMEGPSGTPRGIMYRTWSLIADNATSLKRAASMQLRGNTILGNDVVSKAGGLLALPATKAVGVGATIEAKNRQESQLIPRSR